MIATRLLTKLINAPAPATSGIECRVKQIILKLLFDQLPRALLATVINSSLLAYIVSDAVPGPAPKLWLGAILLMCAVRAATIVAFRKKAMKQPDYVLWRSIFAAGAIATAVLWGLSGVILFPAASPLHQTFLGFVLAGMAAGASGSMSAHDKIFRIYLVLLITPYMLRLFAEGTPLNIAMATMCATFIVMVSASAARNARLTRDALRLRFVNDELAHDLERTLLRNQASNNALQNEITKHQRTMESLEAAVHDAQSALTAKSQFLANMSHEIRTPMNGVFGMTDLLMRTTLDARQMKLVGTINESAKSLLTIINDILDLSRIEAGKLDLDKHEFNLRELIEQSVDLFAGQCNNNGLELSLYFDRDVPVFVKGDSGRIKQVVLNLIGNAIKFTKFGEIGVRVTTENGGSECARVRIEIRDTGIGIDRAVLDKLFQPFEQAETSISRRFGGTGLGLAIARHLTEMMGGTIDLASEFGKGTVATIELPLEKDVTPRAAAASDLAVLEGARILVIDDRDTNREIMANYLEGSAANVSVAASTAAAWPMLVAADAIGKPYHAAVVDMIMPEETGLEFANRIKAHPTLSKLKIILATSLSWSGDAAALREAGVEAVLTKPIRRSDLVDAAARAVSGTRHAGWTAAPGQLLPAAAGQIAPPARAINGARVLLAEDNPVNVEVAKEYLSSFGCVVSIVANGLDAVAAVQSTAFDIVLMDCQMAIMDGLTATRRIRSIEQEGVTPPVPIVALTANAFAEDRVRCLDAGMNDYLSKPYSEQQLYAVLAKWLPLEGSRGGTVANGAGTADTPLDAPAQAPPCLDNAVLAPMRCKRPELLARIISAYLEHAPKVVEDLQAAAREGDLERMARHAHSLKSSSANLGAAGLSSCCRELESAANADDLAASRVLTEKIDAMAQAVKAALERELSDLSAIAPAKAAIIG